MPAKSCRRSRRGSNPNFEMGCLFTLFEPLDGLKGFGTQLSDDHGRHLGSHSARPIRRGRTLARAERLFRAPHRLLLGELSMPRKEMQKFAATKHKALPEKVRRRKR